MGSSVHFSNLQLVTSILLLVFMMGLSYSFRAAMTKPIFIAGARMVVQLLLIGYVLEYIFHLNQVGPILIVAALMIAIAIHANGQRVSKRPDYFWQSSSLAISLCVIVTLSFSLIAIVRPEPWYSPRYLIPFLGLIIGNTLTGVSLGMESIITSVDENRDKISAFLALGAHPKEAGSPYFQKAIKASLTPILNSMTITGLVSLPGVMTGQILAGAPPGEAARYQIVVLCILGFSTTLGSTLAVFFFYRHQFNSFHCLRNP